MRISVIHDYADALRATRALPRLQGHEVITLGIYAFGHIGGGAKPRGAAKRSSGTPT